MAVKLFANILERQKDQKIQSHKNSLKRLRVQLTDLTNNSSKYLGNIKVCSLSHISKNKIDKESSRQVYGWASCLMGWIPTNIHRKPIWFLRMLYGKPLLAWTDRAEQLKKKKKRKKIKGLQDCSGRNRLIKLSSCQHTCATFLETGKMTLRAELQIRGTSS